MGAVALCCALATFGATGEASAADTETMTARWLRPSEVGLIPSTTVECGADATLDLLLLAGEARRMEPLVLITPTLLRVQPARKGSDGMGAVLADISLRDGTVRVYKDLCSNPRSYRLAAMAHEIGHAIARARGIGGAPSENWGDSPDEIAATGFGMVLLDRVEAPREWMGFLSRSHIEKATVAEASGWKGYRAQDSADERAAAMGPGVSK